MMKEIESGPAFMYTGLPGAGKTTVAELAQDNIGGMRVNTGTIVRGAAEEQGYENPTSEELGEFAAKSREIYGDGFAIDWFVEDVQDGTVDVEYPVHFDGVRNVAGVEAVREFATDALLIYVNANFERRLHRLRQRDRDDESEFEPIDLVERDANELNNLGTAEILNSDEVDVIIENDYDDIEPLRREVGRLSSDYQALYVSDD